MKTYILNYSYESSYIRNVPNTLFSIYNITFNESHSNDYYSDKQYKLFICFIFQPSSGQLAGT